MSRHFVSIVLTVIFLGFVSAPTIVQLVDDSIDISLFFSYAEEEEKGATKSLNKEIVVPKDSDHESGFLFSSHESNMGYVLKNYAKPHLNLVSPPPDVYIL